MIAPGVQGLPDLGTKALVRQRKRFPRDGLPVEPGRPGRDHLRSEVQV